MEYLMNRSGKNFFSTFRDPVTRLDPVTFMVYSRMIICRGHFRN